MPSSGDSTFSLFKRLKAHLETCEQGLDADQIVGGFVATLTQDELIPALTQALRGSLASYMGLYRAQVRDSVRTDNGDGMNRETVVGNRSSKWGNVQADHEDGSLDAYMRIIRLPMLDRNGSKCLFGQFGIEDLECKMATLDEVIAGASKEKQRHADVKAQMLKLKVATVAELPAEWLVERWGA